MHDITFAKEIISAIENKLDSLDKKSCITVVNTSLSPMTHVKPEGLRQTYMSLVKGTPLEAIALKIRPLKIGMACNACKEKFEIDKPTFLCPKCHSSDITIVHTKEFSVDSIEVEKAVQ